MNQATFPVILIPPWPEKDPAAQTAPHIILDSSLISEGQA
jgi:hypothetical protein